MHAIDVLIALNQLNDHKSHQCRLNLTMPCMSMHVRQTISTRHQHRRASRRTLSAQQLRIKSKHMQKTAFRWYHRCAAGHNSEPTGRPGVWLLLKHVLPVTHTRRVRVHVQSHGEVQKRVACGTRNTHTQPASQRVLTFGHSLRCWCCNMLRIRATRHDPRQVPGNVCGVVGAFDDAMVTPSNPGIKTHGVCVCVYCENISRADVAVVRGVRDQTIKDL